MGYVLSFGTKSGMGLAFSKVNGCTNFGRKIQHGSMFFKKKFFGPLLHEKCLKWLEMPCFSNSTCFLVAKITFAP